MTRATIRIAVPADLDALVALEQASFAGDRMSRRSLRRLLTRDSAVVVVDVHPVSGALRGSAVVLFRRGLDAARLYSIAVDAGHRQRGLGGALVEAALRVARDRGCTRLRLEVRHDNAPAIRLYERLAFRRIGLIDGYYADGATALRFEGDVARDASGLADVPEPAGPRRQALPGS